ncbi:MAG TPA: dephospho-CoA kinase [Anaerolineales bacterium]|nr:dephospho-CoA kinase [Anaerolineales bacterium]
MSAWPGKYVIGLTGNIATGKSVVRKMLEHLGAFGIDADGISHQAMAKGGPAYGEVIKAFGEFIVGNDEQIDRAALSNVVFSNAKALAKLEAIIHPIVRQAINILSARAMQKVIVIEAIKLLDGDLAGVCDSIWVVHSPEEQQIARLVQKRKMSAEQIRARLAAQGPQTGKLKRANVIIRNAGTFEDTWTQVQAAWGKISVAPQPERVTGPLTAETPPPTIRPGGPPSVTVRRGKPGDAAAIATFITRASNNARSLSRADVMEAFGEKAFVLAQVNAGLGALAGWQVENLVTRVDDFYFLKDVPPNLVIKPMLDSIEAASRDLQSEASFIFIPPTLQNTGEGAFTASGYEMITPDSISITAWREAVKESQPTGTVILFKKLREDRVLRPV